MTTTVTITTTSIVEVDFFCEEYLLIEDGNNLLLEDDGLFVLE